MGNSDDPAGRITIRLATPADRDAIYGHRHTVYALELGQHAANAEGRLTDALDVYNEYVVALRSGEITGFISLTPPGRPSYSVDKYFPRSEMPFAFDDTLHEVRLLTVLPRYRGGERGGEIAGLLLYAAFRWVEAQGGRRIVAIGRREVLGLYLRVGLRSLGRQIRSGAVTYELLTASTVELREQLRRYAIPLRQLEPAIDWRLGVPFSPSPGCVHGGAGFESIGDEFDGLDRAGDVLAADVLDAWFPPAPRVLAALQEHVSLLLRTSPPVQPDGLTRAIARARGVGPECILPGAGSSSLIHLALRRWLMPDSRVLLLDPMYGEYAYLAEQVLGCRVDRLVLRREEGYALDLDRLRAALATPYDLIVLVNPNNPTGRHVPRASLAEVLRQAPRKTLVWVDEAYLEYAGPDQSLEGLASRGPNVVVCKSLSKVYALSGVRAAYLCGPAERMEELRPLLPPYAVSLPAQVAGVLAIQDVEYYPRRWRETHRLREDLADGLRALGVTAIVPGVANFLLVHLPEDGPDAATITARCRDEGLLLRNLHGVGSGLGLRAVRIAVRDGDGNRRMLAILSSVLRRQRTVPS